MIGDGDRSHRDLCAISGIGASDFSRDSGRSVLTIATEASIAAIADAGIDFGEVDGLIRSDYDEVGHNDLAHSLGLTNVAYWGATGVGGAAPCGMIGQAVGAILAGLATNVLVYRALNGRSGVRFGRGTAIQAAADVTRIGGRGTYDEFFLPYGLIAPGQMYALVARRHMIEYGTKEDDLAAVALACRARANNNPAAQMHDRELTLDQYYAGRMVADPLRVFDHCLESDGACAVVVTTTERAKNAPQKPALIRSVAQGMPADPQPGKVYPMLTRPSITRQPSEQIAATLYRRAGLGPGDIDVAQIYDCFTITVLLQLEDYGFCGRGESGAFASSGALGMKGSLPMNTAGGNLSEAYIHGMNHVVEGVRQMRGTSTSQVDGAETCLVTSGIPTPSSAMILRAG